MCNNGQTRMKNIYHSDIVNLLIREGTDGMRLRAIARRVYNLHASLFNTELSYTVLRCQITSYLWKQSRRRDSPFCRVGYGTYAIRSSVAVQLDLFWDAPEYHVRETRQKVPHHTQLTFDF